MPRSRRPKRERDEGALPGEWTVREAWPFPSGAEIEQRFEELIRRRWGSRSAEPPADVFVLGRELMVELDLPGVELESVQVRYERGELLVEAHRPAAAPGEQARPARLERSRGALRRRIPLPPLPGAGRVEFRLEAGVLRVHVRPEDET
jgi:HSP20 family molecular chaperone IbpA